MAIVYAAKASLVEKMEEAEEAGIDVSAAEAVLNNVNATVDDVNNAINALINAIANQVTPDNPVDMTSLIKEATCDSHSYWVSTAIAANDNEKIQNNAIATNRCTDAAANVEGAFEGKFWENWAGVDNASLLSCRM